jgi:hypothetical protein
MVLGLGRAKDTASDLLETSEESGESLASQGFFPTVLTYDQFSGPLDGSTFTPRTEEWVNVLYYQVADQENFVIGSKAPESEEIGKVNIELKATGTETGTDGNVPEDMRVRVGYETANGRASYPVFNYPAGRLHNDDVEQRVQQAPKRWALMRDGSRNGIAGSNDRIFVSVYANSTVEIGTDSVVELPGMLSEE